MNMRTSLGIADVLGTQIAFKCGSWNKNTTDVLVKDIHYTGQAETAVYPVTGKVLDTQGSRSRGKGDHRRYDG